jgi:hypothetical protein
MKKKLLGAVLCLLLLPSIVVANGYEIFGGMCKLGIAAWGFSQKNAYGNITGSIFALSGTIQIIAIRW